jgi:hypothetical protein
MNSIIKALALIVAGVTLYTPYKIIGTAAKFIGQFGSDNDGKKETMRRILGIQSGGLFIFYGCYIVATGLICIILEIVKKECFIYFLIGGVFCSFIGLCIACYTIFLWRPTSPKSNEMSG